MAQRRKIQARFVIWKQENDLLGGGSATTTRPELQSCRNRYRALLLVKIGMEIAYRGAA